MTAKRHAGSGFPYPMTQVEQVLGWVYVFVHMFAMSYILSALNAHVFPLMGFQLSTIWLNFLYYAVGFCYLLGFLFHYLRESFADMCGNFLNTVIAVLVGFIAYVFLYNIVRYGLHFFLENLTNPNSAAVNATAKLNPNKMLVIGVLLAPVVEETLFRGVVFGSLRRKNALLGYFVSTVLFAVYHLWSYLIHDFHPSLFLYLLQYLPAGLALGWAYDYSKTLYAPIFLHMMINYVVITVQIG